MAAALITTFDGDIYDGQWLLAKLPNLLGGDATVAIDTCALTVMAFRCLQQHSDGFTLADAPQFWRRHPSFGRITKTTVRVITAY